MPEAATSSAVHGVLVTFNRPESLARMVAQLAGEGIASLTVVDNAPSPSSRHAARSGPSTLPVSYIEMPENTGPAGGLAAGMTEVMKHAADDDWMLVLDDDRLTGSPGAIVKLRELGERLSGEGRRVGAVGIGGARFDRRLGRLTRLPDDELHGAVRVDSIGGNQLLMTRVGAARNVGVFDRDLFFGFDDLDYSLRLLRAGYEVYADSSLWLEARERFGRLGDQVGAPPRRVRPWRRYYAVRNHIVVARRYARPGAAVLVTLAHLVVRPAADLLKRRPQWFALSAASARGCFDAWTGRLGRRVEATPETATSDAGVQENVPTTRASDNASH